MPDPLDWCLDTCACGGRERASTCPAVPGCPNCLEIVGMMGHVVGTLSGLLVVHLHPGETVQTAISRMLEEEQSPAPPRWMN